MAVHCTVAQAADLGTGDLVSTNPSLGNFNFFLPFELSYLSNFRHFHRRGRISWWLRPLITEVSPHDVALMDTDSTQCMEWEWLSELTPSLPPGRLGFECQLLTPNTTSIPWIGCLWCARGGP